MDDFIPMDEDSLSDLFGSDSSDDYIPPTSSSEEDETISFVRPTNKR